MKKLLLGIAFVLALVGIQPKAHSSAAGILPALNIHAQIGPQCFAGTRITIAANLNSTPWWEIEREECYLADVGYYYIYWTDINGATPNPPSDDGD